MYSDFLFNFFWAGLLSDNLTSVILAIILLAAGWKSFKAIESSNKSDDTTWLMFWFIYALVQAAQQVLEIGFKVLIPYYNESVITLLVWCAFFGGAEQLYLIIRPWIYELKVEDHINAAHAGASDAAGEARDAIKKHME